MGLRLHEFIEDNKLDLAGWLRASREALVLSQSEVEALAGLAPGHVSKIERGQVKDVSTSTFFALAQAVGWSFEKCRTR